MENPKRKKSQNPHRLIIATIWGIVFATTVEKTSIGRYILKEINWLAVLIGVGVCWVIAAPKPGNSPVDQAKRDQHYRHFFILAWASLGPILSWAWNEKPRINETFIHRTPEFDRLTKSR